MSLPRCASNVPNTGSTAFTRMLHQARGSSMRLAQLPIVHALLIVMWALSCQHSSPKIPNAILRCIVPQTIARRPAFRPVDSTGSECDTVCTVGHVGMLEGRSSRSWSRAGEHAPCPRIPGLSILSQSASCQGQVSVHMRKFMRNVSKLP